MAALSVFRMKFFISILLISATLSLFVSFSNYIFSSDVNLEYYKKINGSLHAVAEHIDKYYQLKNIYPTNSVVSKWSEKNSSLHSDVRHSIKLYTNNYPAEVTNSFTPPDLGGYALTIWTGDFFISYVSWENRISEDLSPPIAKYAFIAAILYFFSWFLWSQHLTRPSI